MITLTDEEYEKLKELADYQIPKKPKVVYRIRENHCPTCGVCLDERWDKFCFQCGQSIDWSDEKED
jgi:hypothetical protein